MERVAGKVKIQGVSMRCNAYVRLRRSTGTYIRNKAWQIRALICQVPAD